MPFIKGQGTGLIAGIIMIVFYSLCYAGMKLYRTFHGRDNTEKEHYGRNYREGLSTEFSEELADIIERQQNEGLSEDEAKRERKD
jgi:hypothetical protein